LSGDSISRQRAKPAKGSDHAGQLFFQEASMQPEDLGNAATRDPELYNMKKQKSTSLKRFFKILSRSLGVIL
jgi:hypothetical protein